MKRMILTALIGALLPFLAYSQDDGYTMVETVYLKPKAGSGEKFVKAVKAHNEKYHKKDTPYNAWLETIITGPYTGWHVWIMGPCTFTQLDGRPGKDEGHDADWNKSVTPYVEKVKLGEYWKRWDDLSYRAEGDQGGKMSTMWFIDIKKGEWSRFKNLMKQVKAVYEMRKDESYSLWGNQFNADDGRDVVIVWNFDKWAELDDDSNFKADFEEVHGEGTFDFFLDEWEASIESRKEEVWMTVE